MAVDRALCHASFVAGHYNSRSWETGFFLSSGGSWDSEYGRFFLSWYSGMLLTHADDVLSVAAEVCICSLLNVGIAPAPAQHLPATCLQLEWLICL